MGVRDVCWTVNRLGVMGCDSTFSSSFWWPWAPSPRPLLLLLLGCLMTVPPPRCSSFRGWRRAGLVDRKNATSTSRLILRQLRRSIRSTLFFLLRKEPGLLPLLLEAQMKAFPRWVGCFPSFLGSFHGSTMQSCVHTQLYSCHLYSNVRHRVHRRSQSTLPHDVINACDKAPISPPAPWQHSSISFVIVLVTTADVPLLMNYYS